MSELKECPFCGEKLIFFGHDLDRRQNPPVVIDTFRHPYYDENDPSKDCCLSQLVFDALRWNKRPGEDAKDLEILEMKGLAQTLEANLRGANDTIEDQSIVIDKLKEYLRDANIEAAALDKKIKCNDYYYLCKVALEAPVWTCWADYCKIRKSAVILDRILISDMIKMTSDS